jgi:hypothetical protein
MSRKSLLLTLLIVFALAGAIGTGLVLLLGYEPRFYVRAAIPAGQQRKDWNDKFQEQFTNLLTGILNGRVWGGTFEQQWVNSYFAEDYVGKHSAENPLPPDISEPRLCLEKDRIRLGFRYGKGPWSTVVSLTVRAWLVPREQNTIALEFESLQAGALPISAQSLLQRIGDFAHQKDIDPTWYRRNGHPVLVLRLQADRSHPTFLLQRLDVSPGTLTISGRDSSSQLGSAGNVVSLKRP